MDLSNLTFPSSLQNTETRFVLCLRYPVCVNLQRFYDTHLRQFTEILRYPVCVNLQRFYDAQGSATWTDIWS